MKTRVLAAIPIAAVLIVALILQSWVLYGLVVFLAFVSEHEILHALSSGGTAVIHSVPYVMCGVIPLVVVFFANPTMLIVAYGVAIMVMFIIAMFSSRYDYNSLKNSIFAIVYPQLLFVFIYLLIYQYTNFEIMGTNPFILLLGILPPIFCDTAAYFVGRAFGKKKLCPEISPKKTVAGAIGGIIGGVIAGLLVWVFFGSGFFMLVSSINVWVAIIIGAVVAGVSQFGDLSASFVKRHYGIKDYSNLIPGHGGIMDRIDSMLFAIPALYFILFFYSYFMT